MKPRERIMATLMGEEPDKIPVVAADWLRKGSQGGWSRRLMERGLGIIRWVSPYKPFFIHPHNMNPQIEGIDFTQKFFVEKGTAKCRNTFDTPVGSLTELLRFNKLDFGACATEENLVKEPSDWRVMNYIFRASLDKLAPNYEPFELEEDELGDNGMTFAVVEKTPFQRSFVELASTERTIMDFAEKPDDFIEFLDIQRKLHERIAEIVAGCPAKFVEIVDHISDVISPAYYKEYCIPYYEIYSNSLKGTGKILGVHMDGRFGHIKKEVVNAPFNVVESFTVPPLGDLSITEAKEIWPDKMLFVNCPPHLNWAEPKDVRNGFSSILEEWGSKKGLIIEHSEEIPLETLETNLSCALDVFGY
ncbi:MAG: hypothetical protein APF76_06405 [Desulfitibacter sp. BRH_c19]|nr:MAG: hypothetical protein APF76_06405 [Desulfitibacter sp. BRH_c19]